MNTNSAGRPPVTLVVIGHPGRPSFTSDWADGSVQAAKAEGHDVLISDLRDFDAVERARSFGVDGGFDPLKAHETLPLPLDAVAEAEKIEAADRIILHFPMWWFAPPAVIKGWCDRALIHGRLHSVDRRFDSGHGRGKSVLFCVSTGATEDESGPHGKEGDARLLLWPLAYTFRYCGFSVLEPVLVHGVHGYHEGAAKDALQERLRTVIAAQRGRVAGWDNAPRMTFPADSAFDETGRLRAGEPASSPFIRPLQK